MLRMFWIDDCEPLQCRDGQQHMVCSYEGVEHSSVLQVERHGQLQGIQRVEAVDHAVFLEKLVRHLIVADEYSHDDRSTSAQVCKEPAT